MSNAKIQIAKSDAYERVHWVAPLSEIVTFSADAAIDAKYLAVTPQTEATFYYDNDNANTFTVPALYTIPLPKDGEMKFTAQMKCIVF